MNRTMIENFLSTRLGPRGAAAVLGIGFLAGAALLLTIAQPIRAAAIPVFTLRASPDLPAAGTRVAVTVTPQNFAASSTMFTWYENGERIDAVSGLGRAAVIIATDPDRSQTIQVRVTLNAGPEYALGDQSLIVSTLPPERRQTELLTGMASDFTLEAETRAADPGETVRVEVVTFAFDRNAATYNWYVDGLPDRAASGRGRSRIEVVAAAEGGARNVRVDVLTPSGETRTQSVTIDTISVPLYWWAETNTPSWYRGKALPSTGARVTVMALPNVPGPGQLLYQWRFNGAVVSAASGAGRQTFSFPLTLPIRESIEVGVRNAGGGFEKTAGLSVGPTAPIVGIYELRPLRGIIMERALGAFAAPTGDDYDFVAVPFFFPNDRVPALDYRWSLNGREIAGVFTRPWLFTLEGRAGLPSEDALEVEVRDQGRDGSRAGNQVRTLLR